MSIHTILLIQIVMPKVTRVSAITLRVSEMGRSMRFYRDLLGLSVRYGGDEAYFSSLILDGFFLNLELSRKPETAWGRIIFYCDDVGEMYSYLKVNGYHPDEPKDAPWGERFFHLKDPDGHELSFAEPINDLHQ